MLSWRQSVIYGDLKPSNLLLDENGKIKLGGFGLSRRLADIGAVGGTQPASQVTSRLSCPKMGAQLLLNKHLTQRQRRWWRHEEQQA